MLRANESCRGHIIRTYDSKHPYAFQWREPPKVDADDLILGNALKQLPKGTPYPASYLPPRISVNACYAFDKVGMQATRIQLLKDYHRSWITQENLKAATYGYGRVTYKPSFKDDLLERVVNSVRDEFRDRLKVKLTSWSVEKVMRDGEMPKTTSPGIPYIQEGIKSKAEAYERDKIRIRRMHQDVRKGKRVRFPDCAAFARSIVSKKDKNKVRLVWAYPLSQVLLEAKYALPLIKAIIDQDIGLPLAYGAETRKGGMQWLNSELSKLKDKYNNIKFCCIDYKSFDQTVPPWLIRIAFDILEECFFFDRFEDVDGVRNTDVKSTDYEWRQIKNYFINTPLRMENGDRYMKTGGVPSGSCFTNLIDSVVNLIVMRYALESTTGSPPKFMVVLGDDSVSAVTGNVNMKDISRCADEKFGILVNVDKSFWTNLTNNVQFLGYYNCYGYPMRNLEELLAVMLYPDSSVDESLALTMARFLGITQASCGSSLWPVILTEFMHDELKKRGKDFIVDVKRLYHLSKQFGWLPAAGEKHDPLPRIQTLRKAILPTQDCPKLIKNISLVI